MNNVHSLQKILYKKICQPNCLSNFSDWRIAKKVKTHFWVTENQADSGCAILTRKAFSIKYYYRRIINAKI
jgi:hypothetical protein